MSAITPNPTSPEAKGTAQVESARLSTEYLARSTSGVDTFTEAQSKVVPLAVSDYDIPGNVVGGMKNKYIVLANKKIFSINASGALSALKKSMLNYTTKIRKN